MEDESERETTVFIEHLRGEKMEAPTFPDEPETNVTFLFKANKNAVTLVAPPVRRTFPNVAFFHHSLPILLPRPFCSL